MTAQLIQFPRAKKRGPKVRSGPSASLLQFPAQMVGAELQRRWVWLSSNWSKWANEEIDGERDPDDRWSVEASYLVGQAAKGRLSEGARMAQVDPAARDDIRKWEAHIRKRTAVKDWLERLGVDWDDARGVEDALFFAYDRLAGRVPPSVA